jgi:ribosomal-protein-alanine N-acetyltransferase
MPAKEEDPMLGRPPPAIETARLRLALPEVGAARRVAAYFRENRAHHAPWEPPRDPAFYTDAFWQHRLAQNRAEWQAGKSLRLFLARREDPDGEVLGTCSFTEVVRGAFQACYLGYGLGSGAQGHGFMSEALAAACAFAFDEMRLHRIMANYVPENARSGRVLKRLGFSVEGYARDYLFVGGAWRDHVLTALTSPRPVAPGP